MGRNVHCLGLLRPGDAGAGEVRGVGRGTHEYLVARCRAAAAALFGDVVRRGPGCRAPDQVGRVPEPDLRRWSRAELEPLLEQLWQFALAEPGAPGAALGNLLFAEVPDDSEAVLDMEVLRCVAVLQEIRERREAAAAEAAAAGGAGPAAAAGQLRLFAAVAPPAPGAPRLQASVSRLRVSRVGSLSCPVHCLAVLLGAAPVGNGDARAAALAARVDSDASPMLRALDDVTSLDALRDASAAGALPRIIHVGAGPAGTWAEFEPRGRASEAPPHAAPPSALWPVAWFAFTPRAEAEAQDAAAVAAAAAAGTAPPDEDRFDVFDAVLRARHGGDLACVKLISSEDLMAQWGDERPEPTIDVASVELHGHAATLEAQAE